MYAYAWLKTTSGKRIMVFINDISVIFDNANGSSCIRMKSQEAEAYEVVESIDTIRAMMKKFLAQF
jgi:hypothetical protein